MGKRKDKQRFSGFTVNLALIKLKINQLNWWDLLATHAYVASDFLAAWLQRLENFAWVFSERS
jgi:hypothetical protein